MVKTRNSIGPDEDGSADRFLSIGRRQRGSLQGIDYEVRSDYESDEVQISNHMRVKAESQGLERRRRRKRQSYKEVDSADDFIEDISFVQDNEQAWRRICRNNNAGNGDVRRSSRQKKLVYGTFDQKVLDKALYMNGGEDIRPAKKRRKNEVDLLDIDKSEDMYSRVKRPRRVVKRDMYGIPVKESSEEDNKDEDGSNDEDEDDSDDGEDGDGDDDDEEEEEEEEDEPEKKVYHLREHKPRTQLYEVPIVERRKRVQKMFGDSPPPRPKLKTRPNVYRSPARRKVDPRRRAAFHGSDTTSSSSSDGERSDEERFQRRQEKSIERRRNRCLPMNLTADELKNPSVLKDRVRIGSSLADVDPMNIDRTIDFKSVGGLGKHVRSLKEMIVFPLLYPEVFEKFKLAPPRGVLFYGPPGTGKTLVARALANECSHSNRKVSFFMRKGADCLSKWVGESERQLRLLFDQAYLMRPSIIFFDEIDGLAPVRSSRQDQIHSSIVSTLLALMDGLDSRGEIVVIGATNRIDSIDPALRRPGRFDREFLFPLPSEEARRQILQIQTKDWNPKLCDMFVRELSEKTVGYCGADIKALCTEASLLALRRRYPQIYATSEKLQINVSSIVLAAKDFFNAMQSIVPASQRSVSTPARALPARVQPLLKSVFNFCIETLQKVFPVVVAQLKGLDSPAGDEQYPGTDLTIESDSDEDESDVPSIFESKGKSKKRSGGKDFSSYSSYACKTPVAYRPRMLLAGQPGQGQTTHIAPAIIHHLEQLPVHVLDLPSLFAVSSKTPEEACAQTFREARRTTPSIIYMPHIEKLWNVLTDTLRATFTMLLSDIDPTASILLLATSECEYGLLHDELMKIFDSNFHQVVDISHPSESDRRGFFKEVLLKQATHPPSRKKTAVLNGGKSGRNENNNNTNLNNNGRAKKFLEILPVAPPPEPRKLTDKEMKALYQQEEATLRELRLFLRDVINKLGRDRKFHIFAKAVDIEDAPDYYEIIEKPMDLGTMMSKIDLHRYQTAKEFLEDINLICFNALEYNPEKNTAGRAIRHRACALKDTAEAILKAELDPDFEKQCEEIAESRKQRGIEPGQSAPKFYHTKPAPSSATSTTSQVLRSRLSENRGRTSRRLRGLDIEETSPLELVEKQWTVEKSIRRHSPTKSSERDLSASENEAIIKQIESAEKKKASPVKKRDGSGENLSGSTRKKRDVWGRSSYRSRKRRRNFHSMSPVIVIDTKFSDTDDYDVPEIMSEKRNSQSSGNSHGKNENLSGKNISSENKHCENSLSDIESSHIDNQTPCKSRLRHTSGKSPERSGTQKTSEEYSSSKSHGAKNLNEDSEPPVLEPAIESMPQVNGEKTFNLTVDVEDISTNSSLQEKLASKSAIGKAKEIDSGISSSVDSNGDSLDSIEQAKNVEKQKLLDGKEESTVQENEAENVSPAFRVTRARLSQEHEQAMEVIEEPPQPLIIDHERLVKLLNETVLVTERYNVEDLEKLYNLYSNCILSHSHEYDRTKMIEELEDILQKKK